MYLFTLLKVIRLSLPYSNQSHVCQHVYSSNIHTTSNLKEKNEEREHVRLEPSENKTSTTRLSVFPQIYVKLTGVEEGSSHSSLLRKILE